MSANGSDSQPEDNMQRPEPETPDSPSNVGGDLGHFTDWREQLRDRVREIRARKLADKRGEDAAATPEPDPAEQAAAARAEKLRAARDAIEGTRPDPDAGLESARIERRIEERIEEIAEEVAEEVAEAELEDELDEMPQIAARTELEPEMTLGARDRSARRSEIADVVDSLLGPLDETSAGDPPDEMEEIDLDALFGHGDDVEAPETVEATAEEAPEQVAIDEVATDDIEVAADDIADEEWEAIAAADARDREPVLESADAESIEDEDEYEEEGAADETDPFASAPAWARASFAPRKPRPSDEPTDAVADSGVPAELEDVNIPSWALPRATERHQTEEAADLFAAEDDTDGDPAEADRASAAEIAARALDSLDEDRETREVDEEADTQEIELDALEEIPAEAPVDADLFAPEEEAEEVELFAAEVDSTPLSDLLASAEEMTDEEGDELDDAAAPPEFAASEPEVDLEEIFAASEPEMVRGSEIDADLEPDATPELEPLVEQELDSSMAAAIEAATASMRPQPAEPEPATSAPEPVEPPKARPTADKARTEGDVFLLGEFRSRGRLTRYETRLDDDATSISADAEAAVEAAVEAETEPVAATASRTSEVPRRHDSKEDVVTTAPIDLFDEAEPEAETDTAGIEWDLDAPGDPDTILDAQRGDADPSAPVADRIFSVVADAMVLLTIAALLAIAGARAADVPVVPFVGAAPLPFMLAVLLFGFAYGVFFTGTCGQTLGKMAMRVRVIGSDTFRVGYPRAAQRVLYYTVAALPAGLGLLPALRDPEHRALHDRLSNTRVVKA